MSLEEIARTVSLDRIGDLLRTEDQQVLAELYAQADRARRINVGEDVHFRGLIEISNYCVRSCAYCGLRVDNSGVERYRMSVEEIVSCALEAKSFGYGTVVLQAGEDPQSTAEWVTELVREVRAQTGLAVTLSLGERTREELNLWRQAGAERYLLRFETSNAELYRRIHPALPGQIGRAHV